MEMMLDSGSAVSLSETRHGHTIAVKTQPTSQLKLDTASREPPCTNRPYSDFHQNHTGEYHDFVVVNKLVTKLS